MYLRRSLTWFVFLIGLLTINKVNAQSDDIVLSLITCEPGEGIEELFGHSAVRVTNKTSGQDYVFNYGLFDFDTPGFTLKFMRGKLPYFLGVNDFSAFLDSYHKSKRGVKEQILNVPNEKKIDIIRFLENNALPENRAYKYDFFFDNCSTRIRDIFEKEVGIDKANYKSNEVVTYRDLLHQFLIGYPWTKFGIDLIIGSRADEKAEPRDQMFLPEKLHDLYKNVTLNSSNFLAPSKQLISFELENLDRKKAHFFGPQFVNLLLVAVIFLFIFMKKTYWIDSLSKIWYVIAFASSLIIVFLWFFTDHIATKVNFNILWLNPLYLFMFYKTNLNKKLITISLILLSVICLLNDFFHYIPQAMPAGNFWFFIILLIYNLVQKK